MQSPNDTNLYLLYETRIYCFDPMKTNKMASVNDSQKRVSKRYRSSSSRGVIGLFTYSISALPISVGISIPTPHIIYCNDVVRT